MYYSAHKRAGATYGSETVADEVSHRRRSGWPNYNIYDDYDYGCGVSTGRTGRCWLSLPVAIPFKYTGGRFGVTTVVGPLFRLDDIPAVVVTDRATDTRTIITIGRTPKNEYVRRVRNRRVAYTDGPRPSTGFKLRHRTGRFTDRVVVVEVFSSR